MNVLKPSRTFVEVSLLLTVSLVVGFLAVFITQRQIENNFITTLHLNAHRHAQEIAAATVNGQVMGAVAALGLTNLPIKSVAKGELSSDDPGVLEALSAVGNHFKDATGVYMVMQDGVISANWFSPGGKSLTGVGVKFRPYYKMAMQGKKNVYVAVGTTTGVPALYFTAPLFSETNSTSPIIGATVVRMNMKPIQSVLDSWASGPSLLLSPQMITLLSNKAEFNALIAKEPSAQALQEIKALKQFGSNFENGSPQTLPFDIDNQVVIWNEQRYALARAPVEWEDPLGPWTLLLMGNLDVLMPLSYQLMVGAAGVTSSLFLGWLGLVFRRRLMTARQERWNAMNDLHHHNQMLAAEAEFKNYLNALANELHLASSHDDFAQRLLDSVVPQFQADYLALYVHQSDQQLLTPLNGFGVKQHQLPTLPIGQGLVGQCAKNQQPIVFQASADVPLTIVWGQGTAKPHSLLFLPLVQMKKVEGVLVLASIKGFNPKTMQEINMLVDTLAIQLGILNRQTSGQPDTEATP